MDKYNQASNLQLWSAFDWEHHNLIQNDSSLLKLRVLLRK